MKQRVSAVLLVCACVIGMSVPAWGDYIQGQEAYLMKDYPRALKLFMASDEVSSLYMIGYMYDHGEGVPQDGKQAAEWYTKAAEKGSVRAQYRLGVMYDNGYGVDQDEKEAVKWYKKAATKGFLPAKEALKRIERAK